MYENYCSSLVTKYFPDCPALSKILSEKRKFGLDKYGEASYQNNFTKAKETPIFKHFHEELIDALNYLLHMFFLHSLAAESPQKDTIILKAMMNRLKDLFDITYDSYDFDSLYLKGKDEKVKELLRGSVEND